VASVEHQEELCALAERVPAGRLGCALASWRERRETPEQTEARQAAAQCLRWGTDADGMIAGTFRLAPGDGAVLTTAVDTYVRRFRPGASADAWPGLAHQRASALVAVLRGGGTAVATEIVVHVRGDGCTLDDGTPIAGSVVERVAPQSFVRALIHDAEGRPINASGRHRHPTARQKRVVRERDRQCVDCGSTNLLECDHEPPYAWSKRTVVEELESRCANCHHDHHRRWGRGR
jgi:hypothetical protein